MSVIINSVGSVRYQELVSSQLPNCWVDMVHVKAQSSSYNRPCIWYIIIKWINGVLERIFVPVRNQLANG